MWWRPCRPRCPRCSRTSRPCRRQPRPQRSLARRRGSFRRASPAVAAATAGAAACRSGSGSCASTAAGSTRPAAANSSSATFAEATTNAAGACDVRTGRRLANPTCSGCCYTGGETTSRRLGAPADGNTSPAGGASGESCTHSIHSSTAPRARGLHVQIPMHPNGFVGQPMVIHTPDDAFGQSGTPRHSRSRSPLLSAGGAQSAGPGMSALPVPLAWPLDDYGNPDGLFQAQVPQDAGQGLQQWESPRRTPTYMDQTTLFTYLLVVIFRVLLHIIVLPVVVMLTIFVAMLFLTYVPSAASRQISPATQLLRHFRAQCLVVDRVPRCHRLCPQQFLLLALDLPRAIHTRIIDTPQILHI